MGGGQADNVPRSCWLGSVPSLKSLLCALHEKLAPAGVRATAACCRLTRLWVVHPGTERRCHTGEVIVDMYKYIYKGLLISTVNPENANFSHIKPLKEVLP